MQFVWARVDLASNWFFRTTMSCALLPDIFDLIVDDLHDDPATLKTCCIVSKSWVPRTRKHLFADIEFGATEPPIELWKKAFPNPSNSPAHYTRNLSIYGLPVITAGAVGGWISAFRNVVNMRLQGLDRTSLVPLHGLSPAVRSLHLKYSTNEVFDLVCSFPLLDDLTLIAPRRVDDPDAWTAPSTSPKLAGFLDMFTVGETRLTTRRLLDLSGGLHFSKISVVFSDDDEAGSVTDLVSGCSDTLETLIIMYYLMGAFPSISVTDQHLTAAHRHQRIDDGFPRTLQDHITQTREASADG